MRPFMALLTMAVLISLPLGSTKEVRADTTSAHFHTHHDTIPNFAESPTIQSAQNGNWSAPNTWNPARVPTTNDIVLVSHTVTFNSTTGDVDTIGIAAGGVLRFSTTQTTRLKVANLLVQPNGALEVGTASNPIPASITAEIIIKDKSPDTTNNGVGVYDPEQWGTSILVIDGVVKMHGAIKSPTFVRLDQEPKAGDTTLFLQQAPQGWAPGDRLILPDTRQLTWWPPSKYGASVTPEWEELTIQSISGSTITLTSALKYDHLGARDGNNQLQFLPHVGNLTRNVVIRSENPNGARGHTAWLHNADADVRYVQFQDLGRTTNSPIDNTSLDANGVATHIGANQIARYPFHAHHLSGPTTPQANGFQTTAIGLAIDNGAQGDVIKWGMAIHATHYGLFRQNVVYHVAGAGILTEDGSESFNVIEENFVMRVRGTGSRADSGCGLSCAREGVGMWFRGPNNYIRDNVVANAVDNYGYTFFQFGAGTQRIPAYQGANPSHNGEYKQIDVYATPLREFARNEVYGATPNGLTFWSLGTFGQDNPRATSRSVVADFWAWHVRQGVFGYQSSKLTIAKPIILGDPDVMPMLTSTGMAFSDYLQKDLVITDATIENFRLGIDVPEIVDIRNQAMPGVTIIQNSFLRNYHSISISAPSHNNNAIGLSPKRLEIRNTRFEAMNVPQISGSAPYDIHMALNPKPISNLVQENEVVVNSYNQIAGNDFRVYFSEQAPGFIVPQSTFRSDGSPLMIASPEAGLTNQQNWNQHGVAIAGEVSPCLDNTSKPEIQGFVCSTGSPNTIPPQSPTNLRVEIP